MSSRTSTATEDSLGGAEWTSGAAKASAVAKIPAMGEKVEKKPSAPGRGGRGARDEGGGDVSVAQSLHGTIEMETDQPTAGGGAVSSAVEMGGKDEDDKVSQ